MDSEAPTNAGHRFVFEAENFQDNENWLKAAEAHAKAAEQFEIAIQDSVDDEAIRTLKLLSSNHQKKSDELNRKAQRLIKAAAKNRMQQMVSSRGGLRNALSSSQQQHHYHQSQEYSNSTNSSIISRLAATHSSVDGEGIGESYTLLPNIERHELDFLNFFESVNKLVDKVSNPAVAFTSAPLNEHDNPIKEVQSELEKSSAIIQQPQHNEIMMDSYFIVTNPKDEYVVNNLRNQLDSLSIHSVNATAADNQDACKIENERLRVQLVHLRKRLKSLQTSAEENDMLKSSVLQFRDDVHKQAKRIMQSHHESSMRSSSSLIAGGPSMLNGSRYSSLALGGGNGGGGGGGGVGSGGDLASRLRDLEEENKQLKLQNEKQKVLVDRYKERWEMLKANAKKRRSPSSLSTVVSNVITEEAEEEVL